MTGNHGLNLIQLNRLHIHRILTAMDRPLAAMDCNGSQTKA